MFVRNGGSWSHQASLRAPNAEPHDRFGASVSISGDTLVVGAHGEDSDATGVNGDSNSNAAADSGAAYVFVRVGSTWTLQAYLKASNTDAGDQFAWSVSTSGDTVAIGAWQEASAATGLDGDQSNNDAEDAGAVYVFKRNASTWTQQAYVKASNTEALDSFGCSVALDSETLIIGADGEDSSALGVNGDQNNNDGWGSGAAYVFTRSGSQWSQEAYLKASLDWRVVSAFGEAVAISGEHVSVGAPSERNGGGAYLFRREASGWSEEAHRRASNYELLDDFGRSIAVSGDTTLVGAWQEDSNATGVNGDQENNSSYAAGAAYVFAPLVGPHFTTISPRLIEALIPGTDQSIHLEGYQLDRITSLTLDGIDVDPSRTTLVSSELITLDMPQVDTLGPHEFALSDGTNDARYTVIVFAPFTPRYENASGDPLAPVGLNDGLRLRLAGIPGRTHWIVFSASNVPSVSRYVQLELGNQFADVRTGILRVIPPSGWIEVNIPPAGLNPNLLGIPLYSQSLDLTLPIPLPVSNLQSLVLVP